jgi:hypothetical protein
MRTQYAEYYTVKCTEETDELHIISCHLHSVGFTKELSHDPTKVQPVPHRGRWGV